MSVSTHSSYIFTPQSYSIAVLQYGNKFKLTLLYFDLHLVATMQKEKRKRTNKKAYHKIGEMLKHKQKGSAS